MFVAQADEAQAVVVGAALFAQSVIAFIQLFACNQRIGNVFECRLNSGFISNDLCLLAQFGYVKIGFVCAPVKDRQGDGRCKSPNTCAALKQAAQLAGSGTDRTGQADARENAARAAPILALACLSACSAARISGRLSNTSELKPAGSLVILNCLFKGKPAGKSSGKG